MSQLPLSNGAKIAIGIPLVLVVHALNEGIIEDTDELIEECGADDTTREVIRLEFEKLENDALSACINAIQMRWPIEGGKGGTDGTTR